MNFPSHNRRPAVRSALRSALRPALRPAVRLALCLRAAGAVPAGLAAPMLALGLGAASISVAQAAPDANSYILGPGDALRVVVQGYPEYNQDSVTVPPDGIVTLPNYGTLKISGKTRLQVQSALAGALKNSVGMRRPVVAVAITTFRSRSFNVVLSGDVPRPGNTELREGQRLSDLLANAGVQERLGEKRATLLRGGRSIPLDLQGAAASPRGASDVALKAGDAVTVKQISPGRIVLSGAVAVQGSYELHQNPRAKEQEVDLTPRLSELIRAAGGLTGGAGAPVGGGADGEGATKTATVGASKTTYTAYLQRGKIRQRLDPEAALAGVGGAADTALQAGDIVTIQTVAPITVYISGLAKNTGSFQVQPGTSLLELLTSEGGPTTAPSEINASVRRTKGGQDKTIPFDLSKLLLSSDSADNLTLQDGDMVQLSSPETMTVTVSGAVKTQGAINVKPGATVLQALLNAGGIEGPASDVRATLIRKGGTGADGAGGAQTILPVNAAGILGGTDILTNYVLQPGDVLSVAPLQMQSVTISGEVNNPGPYQLRQGEGLAELITRAGGVKEDALLTGVQVKRGDQKLQADAYDAVKNAAPLNFDLADGDYIVVPVNTRRIWVTEGVQKPGFYALPERGQLTLLQALGQAQPIPGTKKVSVYRAREDGTVDPGQKPREYSLDDVRRGKNGNIVLEARDIVFVPSPKNKRSIFDVLPIIGALRFLTG